MSVPSYVGRVPCVRCAWTTRERLCCRAVVTSASVETAPPGLHLFSSWGQCFGSGSGLIRIHDSTSVADPKRFVSDQDSTFEVITDSDPDPAFQVISDSDPFRILIKLRIHFRFGHIL